VAESKSIDREAECDRLLWAYKDNVHRIRRSLDQQFRMLHNRAQVLLGICGVLISASVLVTTGRIISRPHFRLQHFAGRALVLAGCLDIGTAAVLVGGVLTLKRWVTQHPGETLRDWILSALAYRDRKARIYRVAVYLMLLSMISYQTAVAIALIQL
jgi:hypothetical protein